MSAALRRHVLRWQRRERAARALWGAAAGLALGGGGAALIALARASSVVLAERLSPWPIAWALLLALVGALGGAGLAAARRAPSLQACARAIDVASGRAGGAVVVAAWDFASRGTAAARPETAALVACAVAAGERAASEARPPTVLGLSVAAALFAGLALVAGAAMLARAPAAAQTPTARERWAPAVARARAVHRALRTSAERARHDRDERRADALVAAASAVLEAAEAMERAGRVATTHEARGEQRSGGAQGDAPAPGSARDRASAGAAAQDAGERALGVAGEALSRALERAAEQLAGAPSTGDPSGTRRELERLTRDLDDAADACRRAPAACARSLEQLERALADGDRRPPGDRGAQATGRGEPTSPGDARAAFERAAQGRAGGAGAPAGERRQPGDRVVAALGAGGTAPRTSDGRAGRDGDGPSERATAAAAAATGSAKAQAVALGSDGPPGDGEGEAPLGRRSNATGGGFATALPDAPDGEGDGPLRAEAIASGASSGFAAPAYQRAWTEYARVAEELVESNAIPAHRRELVRRYFDLIRPRRGTP